jgi:hypothetical protein
MALRSTQALTEMSTRNLPWGKGQSARKADNLTDVSQRYAPPRPVTGIALPFYLLWVPTEMSVLAVSVAIYYCM